MFLTKLIIGRCEIGSYEFLYLKLSDICIHKLRKNIRSKWNTPILVSLLYTLYRSLDY